MALSLIPHNTNINFIGIRRICYVISAIVMAIGIASLVYKGPQYGIDFAGGTLVQVKFSEPVGDEDVKNAMGTTGLPGIAAQVLGNPEDGQYLIRIASADENTSTLRAAILNALKAQFPDLKKIEIERVDMVGAKVGGDLRASAINALYYASLLIAIYVSGRFEQRWLVAGIMAAALITTLYLINTFLNLPQTYMILVAIFVTMALCWKLKLVYALAALIGLVHDVIITIGLLSILNVEIDLIIIAGLLTVIGYSLNDTIIVFDRIRENLRKKAYPKFEETINHSINQTLSRTILTSTTTAIVLLALLIFGGVILQGFSITMIIGVVVGTFSSIFISSPILLAFGEPPKPEDNDESMRIKEMMKKSHDGAVV